MSDDTVSVALTLTEVEILLVALHDLRTPEGTPAWESSVVARLRHKIADAIGAR